VQRQLERKKEALKLVESVCIVSILCSAFYQSIQLRIFLWYQRNRKVRHFVPLQQHCGVFQFSAATIVSSILYSAVRREVVGRALLKKILQLEHSKLDISGFLEITWSSPRLIFPLN
jgi:hypothetical protein